MARDPFANYDAWLEKPIQDAYARGDAFIDWCEREDVDPDAPDAYARYEEWEQEQAEADAESRAESQWDTRREYEEYREEMGYYDRD